MSLSILFLVVAAFLLTLSAGLIIAYRSGGPLRSAPSSGTSEASPGPEGAQPLSTSPAPTRGVGSSLFTAAAGAPEDDRRTVGVEIEVADIPVREAAEAIAALFDGSEVVLDEGVGAELDSGERHLLAECEVETELGVFRVERDSHALKAALGHSASERDLEERIALDIVEPWVPTEIVSPPLPIEAIPRMDEIMAALRVRGAKGTRASPLYALGLHLNPELRDPSAERILAHLRAFFLLRDVLRDRIDVDLSRRASPYIERHGRRYVELVLDPDYAPDLDELVDDYLRLEPTRNRELDMLPLFAHLRPEKVAALGDERVNARPTFHYRLPNSDPEDSSWSVMREWRRWRLVEALANDGDELRAWMRAWREQSAFDRVLRGWKRTVDRELLGRAAESREAGEERVA